MCSPVLTAPPARRRARPAQADHPRARHTGSRRSTGTLRCRTCSPPAADHAGTTSRMSASAGSNGTSRACCPMPEPRTASVQRRDPRGLRRRVRPGRARARRSGARPVRRPLAPLRRVNMDEVDVLIVGAGPAGLVLAAQLAASPRSDGGRRPPRRAAAGRARPTASPAAPWRCSRPSGWPTGWWTRPTGSTRSAFWRPDPADRSRIVRTGRVAGHRGGPVGVSRT